MRLREFLFDPPENEDSWPHAGQVSGVWGVKQIFSTRATGQGVKQIFPTRSRVEGLVKQIFPKFVRAYKSFSLIFVS